jgi:hypothetical protein
MLAGPWTSQAETVIYIDVLSDSAPLLTLLNS